MRLIELRANNAGFKTVKFKQIGLSLIVGTRTHPAKESEDERSYNGVGKSLLVEIVHFCLGSSWRDWSRIWHSFRWRKIFTTLSAKRTA